MSESPSFGKITDVSVPAAESVPLVPEPTRVGVKPAGDTIETLYWPTGRLSNKKRPVASVVIEPTGLPKTLVTAVPSIFVIDSTAPATPASF